MGWLRRALQRAVCDHDFTTAEYRRAHGLRYGAATLDGVMARCYRCGAEKAIRIERHPWQRRGAAREGEKVLAIVDCYARGWQVVGLQYYDADKRPYELTGGSEIQLLPAPLYCEDAVPVRCVLLARADPKEAEKYA